MVLLTIIFLLFVVVNISDYSYKYQNVFFRNQEAIVFSAFKRYVLQAFSTVRNLSRLAIFDFPRVLFITTRTLRLFMAGFAISDDTRATGNVRIRPVSRILRQIIVNFGVVFCSYLGFLARCSLFLISARTNRDLFAMLPRPYESPRSLPRIRRPRTFAGRAAGSVRPRIFNILGIRLSLKFRYCERSIFLALFATAAP